MTASTQSDCSAAHTPAYRWLYERAETDPAVRAAIETYARGRGPGYFLLPSSVGIMPLSPQGLVSAVEHHDAEHASCPACGAVPASAERPHHPGERRCRACADAEAAADPICDFCNLEGDPAPMCWLPCRDGTLPGGDRSVGVWVACRACATIIERGPYWAGALLVRAVERFRAEGIGSSPEIVSALQAIHNVYWANRVTEEDVHDAE